MKYLILQKYNIGFGIALFTLVVIGVFSNFTAKTLIKATEQITANQNELNEIDDISVSIKSMQASARGYVITGHEVYLFRYRDAVHSINRRYEDLKKLVRDDPEKIRELSAIGSMLQESFAFYDTMTQMRTKGGFDAAKSIAMTDKGRMLIDEIQNRVGRMIAEENKLLAAKVQESEKKAKQSLLILSGTIVGFIFLILSVIIVNRDILKRKRIEKELRITGLELARSNTELDRFASVISHDLSEPLRTITGYVQLLEKRYKNKLDAEASEFIERAVHIAARMNTLLTELLEYSRINSSVKAFKFVSAADYLNQALDNLEVSIKESKSTITVDPLPELMADGTQLTQLFQNLIANAIKFHGDEPPKIHIFCLRKDNGWQFTVQDNGIGIDAKHQECIFEIFHRLHTQDQYSGSGMGLAICKKIVEGHGGRIWVESEFGKGSAFHFTVPDRNDSHSL